MEIARTTKTNWMKLMAVAVAGLLLSAAAHAGDWWDGAWTMRKKVTVDTTAAGGNVAEPIGASTVLVRLFGDGYPLAKEDLSDLRFVAEDGKTLLTHHVEKIDALMGEAYVWVKLPDVKQNAKTTFWMYFGSNDAKAAKADDPKGSFDADTVLVFHFNESGQNAGDSTKSNNTTESAGGKLENAEIGSGIAFSGKINVPIAASGSLVWTGNSPATITVWVKATQPNGVIISRRDDKNSFVVGVNNFTPYMSISGQRVEAQQQLQSGSWAHIAVVCDGAATTFFVNGEKAPAAGAGLPAINGNFILGGDKTSGATPFTGEMDELQIHKVARPAGWIGLAAASQGGEKNTKTIMLGADEKPTNWLSWLTTGTFAVIIANLTFDGWAVIIILAIMAVLSWYVMVTKTRYLNGIAKGNEIFMREWRHVASDLTVLDSDDVETSKSLGGRVTKENAKSLRRSSVYRIYHIGVEEIRHRMAVDREVGVRRGLAGRSIQAIRAALDGGLVRETQKINKLIVLLTICISGGPFLGLLGTVVGVMITFAAVAAAGEVNVNAIAPGIAAALLATVAGLAVAIPSLFGYNYILSRVKDAKDDMHIFIDEFVTKMAEFYKDKGE